MTTINCDEATKEDILWCINEIWSTIEVNLPKGETPNTILEHLMKQRYKSWQLITVHKDNDLVAFALVGIMPNFNYLYNYTIRDDIALTF